MSVVEQAVGRIVDYDERTQEMLVRVPYSNFPTMTRREYKDVKVTFIDSRPISAKQRRSCYAMLAEIADWAGYTREEVKTPMKMEFIKSELYEVADGFFSLSDAPMSVIAAFQKFLARFIVAHDVPTKFSLLGMVDDIDDYVYACLISKKCCICGRAADLHHVDRVGMGRDRDDIIHEGMRVLPLCREHHTEAHGMPDAEFFKKWHLNDGIEADRTVCRIYHIKAKGGRKHA